MDNQTWKLPTNSPSSNIGCFNPNIPPHNFIGLNNYPRQSVPFSNNGPFPSNTIGPFPSVNRVAFGIPTNLPTMPAPFVPVHPSSVLPPPYIKSVNNVFNPNLSHSNAHTPSTNIPLQYANFSLPPPLPPNIAPNLSVMPPVLPSFNLSLPPPSDNINNKTDNQSKLFANEKDKAVHEFLSKFNLPSATIANKKEAVEKIPNEKISIVEFRSVVKRGLSLMKVLFSIKRGLSNQIQCEDCTNNTEEWASVINKIHELQDELSSLCDFISKPTILKAVMKRLNIIKKKRQSRRKIKFEIQSNKKKNKHRRKLFNQAIDKWLDEIKEKHEKIKREAEMKKDADFILAEVRRKIHDAKKSLEKLNVLEKLRTVRQENAAKKGLVITSEHTSRFEEKVNYLKTTMQVQLSDYEKEEQAMKVMLETEQEGQLEAESQWRLQKLMSLQDKKKKHIVECLFGDVEEPVQGHPLHLFYQHHTLANASIDNLIKIRQQWDVHLDGSGETIPHQWIVPAAPSTPVWEIFSKS